MNKILILSIFGCLPLIACGQWTKLNSGVGTRLQDVYFINDETGFVVGGSWYPYEEGIALKTTDGGNSWIPFSVGITEPLIGVWFTTDSIGFITGGSVILKTTDQGSTWDTVYTGTGGLAAHTDKIQFTDEANGWALGNQAEKFVRTNDGGITWTDGDYFNWVINFYFLNADSGIFVNFDTEATSYVTKNGGISWSQALIDYNYNSFQSCYATNSQTLIVGESHYYVKVSHNGGSSWSQYQIPYGYYHDMLFVDDTVGYMVGSKIIKTSDGGETWNVDASIDTAILNGIQFPSHDIGYAVGDAGLIVKYNNSIPLNASEVQQPAITAYPNPFNTTIHLYFPGINEKGAVQIFIMDLYGKILFQKTFSYQEEIETGRELPKGFYLMEVKEENHQQVIPVIKQ